MDQTLNGTAGGSLGRTRVAVSLFYFILGLIFSSWAARIPDIKSLMGLNDAQLGGLLFLIPVGQLIAMPVSGWLVSQYGSRRIVLLASVLYPLVLIMIGTLWSLWFLSFSLVLFGVAANLFNISINTQGVGLEQRYGKSIMASFHGLWSLAGFTGGLIGTAMVAGTVNPFFHYCVIYIISIVLMLINKRYLLYKDIRSVEGGGKGRIFTKPDRLIILLGIISFGAMVCEGTMFDWSSVYFEDVVKAPDNLVRLGYIASMLAMTLGRFAADRMITRFGKVNVLRFCGVSVACGLIIAVAVPGLLWSTVGFLFVGLGVSAIVPICYSEAGRSKAMLPGVALAAVSTIGFFGFLLGPPLIGVVAHSFGLRIALGSIAVVGLFIAVIARSLKEVTEGVR